MGEIMTNHYHKCDECGDHWGHDWECCQYPRYTTWHETGPRDYTLPAYPCPDHQWSDMRPVGYPGERWEGSTSYQMGSLRIGVGGQ